MRTKATMIEPLPILTRRSDSTPTMLSPFAIEEERNGISTTRAVMRISRKRGSWILQFADEKQNLRYTSTAKRRGILILPWFDSDNYCGFGGL
jgi:hypothetical protein